MFLIPLKAGLSLLSLPVSSKQKKLQIENEKTPASAASNQDYVRALFAFSWNKQAINRQTPKCVEATSIEHPL